VLDAIAFLPQQPVEWLGSSNCPSRSDNGIAGYLHDSGRVGTVTPRDKASKNPPISPTIVALCFLGTPLYLYLSVLFWSFLFFWPQVELA
jgi:hypothetical protein